MQGYHGWKKREKSLAGRHLGWGLKAMTNMLNAGLPS